LRAVGAALLAFGALAVAGCGTEGLATGASDPAHGKELFTQKCGGCHTLREAGTNGSAPQNPSSGPNLDEAFAAPRMEGFDETTIRETVRHQIDYATPPMPRNLVDGSDADAVAAYVALVAGDPKASVGGGTGGGGGGGGGGGDAKSVFATNCGSCHTFSDAGTSGTVGPNLDQAKPGFEEAFTQIKNGGGGMPPFDGRLTDEQIRALARYVSGGSARR